MAFPTIVNLRLRCFVKLNGIADKVLFLFQPKVNVFLILLAFSHLSFALLSHKHLMITDTLSIELERAKTALGDVSKEMREIHSG